MALNKTQLVQRLKAMLSKPDTKIMSIQQLRNWQTLSKNM